MQQTTEKFQLVTRSTYKNIKVGLSVLKYSGRMRTENERFRNNFKQIHTS